MKENKNEYQHLISLALSSVIWWMLVLALLFTPLVKRAAAATEPRPSQVAVLLILDNSTSTFTTDPDGQRFPAAQLFVAMLDEGDAVGILAFASDSVPLTDGMIPIRNEGDKENLIRLLHPLDFGGYTDVKAVFEDARTMLAGVNRTTHRPVVVFLTDGQPEIETPYPSYEEEALAAARALDIPVLAIGLTKEAQTPFLSRLAAETDGAVIAVADASALLDAYVETFGQIKDRVVLDGGVVRAPGQVVVSLDPGLVSYVERASFVVAKPETVQSLLVDPTGMPVQSGATVLAGTHFTVITVERPAAGRWQVQMAGEGEGQVRAILRSRLRVEVTSPLGLHEAGRPMLIEAHLLEEQSDAGTVAIIGEAHFSAQIIRPDGQVDSLDRFYDDGSHGDIKAGDGAYSRLYVNTELPGIYTLSMEGRKGMAAIEQAVRVEVLVPPQMAFTEPSQPSYVLRSEPVPLHVHLADGDQLDRGEVVALVTDPSGEVQEVALQPVDEAYVGSYQTTEVGTYTVIVTVRNGAYRGLAYTPTVQTTFEAYQGPTLTVQGGPVDWGRIERATAAQGLTVELHISTTSPQDEVLAVHLEGMPSFILVEDVLVSVEAGSETTLQLQVMARPDALGPFQGRLVFTTASEGVDVVGGVVSLAGEIFQPALRLLPSSQPVLGCTAELVIPLTVESTSSHTETIGLGLAGLDGVSSEVKTVDVGSGRSKTALTISLPKRLPAGEFPAKLIVQTRAGLPVESGTEIPLMIQASPLWSRCRGPVAAGGVGLVVILAGLVVVSQRVWRASRPAYCQGTLRHWPAGQETLAADLDLTALRKRSITIGSGEDCDLIIVSGSLAEHHARLRAEKTNGGVRVVLEPEAEVQRGYQIVRAAAPLQDGEVFTMGAQTFQYHSDPA